MQTNTVTALGIGKHGNRALWLRRGKNHHPRLVQIFNCAATPGLSSLFGQVDGCIQVNQIAVQQITAIGKKIHHLWAECDLVQAWQGRSLDFIRRGTWYQGCSSCQYLLG